VEDLQRLAKQAEKGWTVGCEEKQNIVNTLPHLLQRLKASGSGLQSLDVTFSFRILTHRATCRWAFSCKMQRRRLLAALIALYFTGASRLHRMMNSVHEIAYKEHGWKPLEMVVEGLKHGMLDQDKRSQMCANECLTVCRQQLYLDIILRSFTAKSAFVCVHCQVHPAHAKPNAHEVGIECI